MVITAYRGEFYISFVLSLLQSSFKLRNKIPRQTKVNKVKKMSVANDKGIKRGGGVLVSLVCSPEPSL